jgi:integrase
MTPETETKTVPGFSESNSKTITGKLVEYSFYMEKQGYRPETIRTNTGGLRALVKRNANLLDPESVKETLAREKAWGDNRRRNIINAYGLFLKVNGLAWEKPRCHVTRQIPFIPTEQEIDSLIAGCPPRVSTFLQLLKETAMRSGEAIRLRWTDLDLERRILTLNTPEKGSLPRQWNTLSSKLLEMLNAQPKQDLRIFGPKSIDSVKNTFSRARRRLAFKLQNPRLKEIHFHTLRHWKATMEYHRTKDVMAVKEFLGHRELRNTEIYIHLDRKRLAGGDDCYISRVAYNVQDAAALVEVGFEYVTGNYDDGGKLFRKRK